MTVRSSDNTTYQIETEEQLESIKKHCAENRLDLFDEQNNKIQLTEKKGKK